MAENVVLYSTGCPKCKVLKMKLAKKNIGYTENTDVDEMLALGMKSAPALKIGDELLDFTKSVAWLEEQKGENA